MNFNNLMNSNADKNFSYSISLHDAGGKNLFEIIRLTTLEYKNSKEELEVNPEVLELRVHSEDDKWDVFFFDNQMKYMKPQPYLIESNDDGLHAVYRELLREEDKLTKNMFVKAISGYYFDKLQSVSDHQSEPALAKE